MNNILHQIATDPAIREAFARLGETQRAQQLELMNQRFYSEYRFSIIYHPNQYEHMGRVDSFSVEGLDNAQMVMGFKMKYNVGIQQIKIRLNGEVVRTLNLSDNEYQTVSFSYKGLFHPSGANKLKS
jgi:hypothetical protein